MAPLIYTEKTASTNDAILSLIMDRNENIGLYTMHQTAGRGQYGNRWQSEPGKNLAYSLAVKKPPLALPESLFNYHTASLVRTFLANLTKKPVMVKWPNDIILNNKKVAGMIMERIKLQEADLYIVGIGINVLQEDFNELPKAGSLKTQAAFDGDIHNFTAEFHAFISSEILKISSHEDVMLNYNAHLFRKDKISVFELNGLRQNGIIKTAAVDGKLLVDLEQDGTGSFYHKEITLLY